MTSSAAQHPDTASTSRSDDGIVTVTIRGRGSLNIVGTPAIAAATRCLADLAGDDTMRVVVLRGPDDKAFVGGADIDEMSRLDEHTARTFIDGLRGLCEATRLCPVPVIARLAGWSLGAGLELAAACDLRVASDGARFGMPEIKVGIPSVIHAALLPRLIGQARAGWLLSTGENIDATQALSWA